jgi:hypothetical protein
MENLKTNRLCFKRQKVSYLLIDYSIPFYSIHLLPYRQRLLNVL